MDVNRRLPIIPALSTLLLFIFLFTTYEKFEFIDYKKRKECFFCSHRVHLIVQWATEDKDIIFLP